MRLPKIPLALACAAVLALPLAAQTPPPASQSGLMMPASTPPRNADGSLQTESQFIAQRVYRALIGREAEPAVLADVAADIERGRLRQRVNSIVVSSEFRGHIYGLTPDRIFADIYQGLFEHEPDASAANWQRLIALAKYADVISGLIATPEFKARLAPFAPAPPPELTSVTGTTALAATPAMAAPAAAPAQAPTVSPSVACQVSIVETIRKDFPGIVFVQFDAAAIDGAVITGAATDVNGGGRRLTYRCDPAASYKYDDGLRERRAAATTEWANDEVGACHREIRLKAQQDYGAARLVFESAALMTAGTSGHLIRGSASERMPSGAAGPAYSYSCDMDGTQVTASSVRAK
jgi:hypothetical protein